jgi:uncharacterized protein YciI
VLDAVQRYGGEVVIFGRVVAASVDRDCLECDTARQYFRLRPLFFLEDGTFATLDAAKRVGAARPVDHDVYLVQVGAVPSDARQRGLVDAHVAFLRELRDAGVLMLGGPFQDDEPDLTGLYVVDAPTLDDAQAIADRDPFAQAGVSCHARPWKRTF